MKLLCSPCTGSKNAFCPKVCIIKIKNIPLLAIAQEFSVEIKNSGYASVNHP